MSDSREGGISRRRFLEMVGIAGGSAAVYETMTALGMINVPGAWAGPPQLAADLGRGRSVLVLGAGVGGLAAAYELRRAGFAVRLLEAAPRAGGRNFTVRRGDRIVEDGSPDQVCGFEPGQYLNAGPGRLPHHHRAILDYCERLGVALEIYVMESRANLFWTSKAFGEAVTNRRIANDTRGHVAELLAKAVARDALDDDLSREDRQRLLDLLATFGVLDAADGYRYKGSSRSGYAVQPGLAPGEPLPPLRLAELLASRFWERQFYQPEDYLWQPTLFQPVGGMDAIVHAFTTALGQLGVRVETNRPVTRVERLPDAVRVRYRTPDGEGEAQADFCVSNLPLPQLATRIDRASFSPGYVAAVAAVPFAPTCKVGWQAERFWERWPDPARPDVTPGGRSPIYGGISYIDHPITQMWYPSSGFLDPKVTRGVLTGAYNYGDTAVAFGNLDLRRRLEVARDGGERLHPGFGRWIDFDEGLSIAWQKVPFLHGGWADWQAVDPAHYRRLLAPDGRFQVVGDQVSQLPGWQEGAVRSAMHAVEQIRRTVAGEETLRLQVDEAPDTLRMTQGIV
ncbi:MAG TPA: FAD-dependent oxidoreductase [Thermoanaerobaculia bacterium]|nr:FAD-dependent oxidoreductase [Thermoanaerobaculia bacterium]